MTERLQVYKCEVCGNIVEVIHAGGGTLVCCNQNMKFLLEIYLGFIFIATLSTEV